MSSRNYSTVLEPDPWLRTVILLSGVLAALTGVAVIATMPVEVPLQIILASAWLGLTAWQLIRMHRRYRFCRRLHVLPDGDVRVLCRDGRTWPGRIRPGSLVLGRVAWLRIEVDGGCCWAEPIAGSRRKSETWRRFQVIWRHLGSDA